MPPADYTAVNGAVAYIRGALRCGRQRTEQTSHQAAGMDAAADGHIYLDIVQRNATAATNQSAGVKSAVNCSAQLEIFECTTACGGKKACVARGHIYI